MAIAFRTRGGVRAGTVYYPDVPGNAQAGDIVFLVVYDGGYDSGGTDQEGSNGTWTYLASAGSGNLYWKRLTSNISGAPYLTITSGRGQMVAFSGVRATGNPYTQVATNSGGSANGFETAGLSGYDKTNAFLVAFFTRTGDVVSGETVTFSGVSGGTDEKATPNISTGGSGGTTMVGYYDGTSGSDGATAFNNTPSTRGNWGAFILDLTDLADVVERAKRWTGTEFVTATAKRWTGSEWVIAEGHRVGE